LIRRPVNSAGKGNIKFPVAGLIVKRLTANKTTVVETVEKIKAGKNIARLLPTQICTGERGVASKDSILPFTFSLITGRLANAHIKVIEIDNDIK
jgi:hypothetical protein